MSAHLALNARTELSTQAVAWELAARRAAGAPERRLGYALVVDRRDPVLVDDARNVLDDWPEGPLVQVVGANIEGWMLCPIIETKERT